jgi:phage tail-like protein
MHSRNFRYCNRDGAWLDFHREGLTLTPDGALEFVSLPRADPVVSLDAEPAPGAIAVSDSGEVYFTENGRIAKRTCMGEIEETDAEAPRAMAVSRRRGALLGLHGDRVVLFDLPGLVESEVWYGIDDGRGLAVDQGGCVYIADASGVRRYFLTGQPDPAFVIDSIAPSALAIADERLFALDGDAVHVFDLEGRPLFSVDIDAEGASGLTAEAGAIYAGAGNAIIVFQAEAGASFSRAGKASGYTGPVAALAVSGQTLWVHAGSGSPAPLALRGAYATEGMLWSDALDAGGLTVEWHRVRAWMDLPETGMVQFFVHISSDETADPEFPGEWDEVPVGVTDFYVGETARFIRVGAIVSGDGLATPRLQQIRTDFDHETYSAFLPETYRLADSEDRFLERFLGAFRSLFDDAGEGIDALVTMLDAEAVSAENLPWLAGFLALNLPESMSVTERRKAVSASFELYAQRGTAAGLRNAILIQTGVHAVIQEPFAGASWWQMPARSPDCTTPDQWAPGSGAGLGIDTVFSGASPQGAVLGSGAVLDQSHLITNAEFGMPLFADLAHRFNVLLYEGEVACPEKRAAVDEVIEREKPAHTAAHVCVVKPALRIGWQGILGVDTVIAGTDSPSRLGEGALVLGGAEAGRIGESATVGISTRL